MDIAGLLATVAFALGAIGGYAYTSNRNEKRLKYNAIKDGLKQYARDNALMRTVDQKLADDDMYNELKQYTASSKASPTETPVEYMPVTI